jgi:hypothetical protein
MIGAVLSSKGRFCCCAVARSWLLLHRPFQLLSVLLQLFRNPIICAVCADRICRTAAQDFICQPKVHDAGAVCRSESSVVLQHIITCRLLTSWCSTLKHSSSATFFDLTLLVPADAKVGSGVSPSTRDDKSLLVEAVLGGFTCSQRRALSNDFIVGAF